LMVARNNVTQSAGLIVVTEFHREEGKNPSAFWNGVWNRVQEWSTAYKEEALLAIASDLTKDLQAKTIRDPNPSSYTLFQMNREDWRQEAIVERQQGLLGSVAL
jgi:hypothetical protein